MVAASLWWIYFDISALHAHRALDAEPEETSAQFARDAYSFLHLPLLIGIVLTALGLKKVLEYVGDTDAHDLGDPLKGVALLALYGGVFVYLLGHVAFRWRTMQQVTPGRLVAAGGLVLTWIVAAQVPRWPRSPASLPCWRCSSHTKPSPTPSTDASCTSTDPHRSHPLSAVLRHPPAHGSPLCQGGRSRLMSVRRSSPSSSRVRLTTAAVRR